GAVTAIEKAHFAGAATDITVKNDPKLWAERLDGTCLPSGSIRLLKPTQISALDGFAEGHWWVQDTAAAMPARILAPRPGEHILDMCAAPGGKTMQLAAAGAHVTAIDSSDSRLIRLHENLKRTDLKAEVILTDALQFEAKPFDAILLDAPCSATGTIRRHPDLPFAKDGSEFTALFKLQYALLDKALSLLAPGGRLVFCTCSLLPDEGEVQVEDFLQRHPNLKVDVDACKIPGVDPSWVTSEGGLRLRPDYYEKLGGMDGFYIACLRRA
ncbi:MAG: RsmB/NOP family class I SAM-dependent RNA methyltransferase, partial [Pseudomonadota bacterium]